MSEQEVRSLNRKMDRVLNILENDNGTNTKGLVSQVAELRDNFNGFVSQYNIDQAIKKGRETVWKIVWGAAGAALLSLGKLLISALFKL